MSISRHQGSQKRGSTWLGLPLRSTVIMKPREAARLAESIARARREGQMRFLAEEVMDQIRSERAAVETSVTPEAVGLSASDVLARDLIRTLRLAPADLSTAARG